MIAQEDIEDLINKYEWVANRLDDFSWDCTYVTFNGEYVRVKPEGNSPFDVPYSVFFSEQSASGWKEEQRRIKQEETERLLQIREAVELEKTRERELQELARLMEKYGGDQCLKSSTIGL